MSCYCVLSDETWGMKTIGDTFGSSAIAVEPSDGLSERNERLHFNRLNVLYEKCEINRFDMFGSERQFGLLVIGFNLTHFLRQVTFTVTLHFRFVFIDAVNASDFLLVDLPLD